MYTLHIAEAFLLRESREKKRILTALFLFLIIPGGIRYLFLFALAISLFPRDIYSGELKLLLELPFSRTALFLLSWGFGVFLLFLAILLSSAIGMEEWEWSSFLSYLIFFTSYFSIGVFATLLGFDNLTGALILLITDLIVGNMAVSFSHLYAYISPFYQKSLILSLAFSILLLLGAWIVTARRKKNLW